MSLFQRGFDELFSSISNSPYIMSNAGQRDYLFIYLGMLENIVHITQETYEV